MDVHVKDGAGAISLGPRCAVGRHPVPGEPVIQGGRVGVTAPLSPTFASVMKI
jgi:hypothetical protein